MHMEEEKVLSAKANSPERLVSTADDNSNTQEINAKLSSQETSKK